MTESLPSAELPRLQTLEQYELLDMPHDPALDDITRLAAQLCNAPVAVISLLEKDRVSFMSRHGIDISHGPRNTVPCETTLAGDGIYQIPDARRDPDYAPGGIPVGDRRYRFYAGAPIVMPSGAAIGCLCVYDTTARKLNSAQLESLDSLSQMIVTRLELNIRARQMDRAARARQRVESALTVERNFVSAVLDTVGALVVVFDTAGRIVRFNRACETISGYASSDLVGKYAWERLIPEEDIAEYIENFENIRLGGFPATYENSWLAADDTRRRISWSATALLDSQGQVAFVIATGIDVTVQRVAEASIRESEARYRQLVEGSLGMVFTHTLDGVVLSINAHGAQSLGRSADEVVGHPFADFIQPDRLHLLDPYFDSLLQTGEAQGLFYLTHTNGEERVTAYRNRLIEEPGRPPYILAFGVDITEQVRAEDQLRSLIRQSNSVLESVGDGIYGIDLKGCVTVVNPAAAQMLGYLPEEILGKNMHDLIHHTRPDGTVYPTAECPIERSLTDRETVRVSNEVFWRKDGTSFPVEYVARPQVESQVDLGEAEAARMRRGFAASSSQLLVGVPDAQGEIDLASGSSSDADADVRAVGVVVAFTDIS
jgi:two-component system sensor histidine kinase VicK